MAVVKRRADRVALMVATVFGVGYAPWAPGSAGSACGLVLWAAGLGPLWAWSPLAAGALFAALAVLALWAAGRAERVLEVRDSPSIVIDEVAGMVLTLAGNPGRWWWLAAGFLAFRLFDIVKPFPVRRLERLPGGLGVVADDLAAAVYANITLHLLVALI